LKSNTHPDPEKDRRGCYKKGYPVSIKPDGWYEGNPYWAQSAYADKTAWVVVDVPDATVEELQPYSMMWRDEFDYEIVSSNPGQGKYTVRVFEKNISVTGKNALTREKVEAFLTKWRCSNISTTTNSVQFDFLLWDAVRSEGFWQFNFVEVPIAFVLISYSGSTGIGRIQATVPLALKPEMVSRRISDRGGAIILVEHPVYTFDIERSVILQCFRQDIKEKAESIYKRRQYSITEAQADAIAAAGGIVTRTKAQVISAMINGLNE
jgi:hypothetical protein